MTAPETAAARLWAACLLGLGLGIWYGFLRPLRPKHTVLSDILFLLGAVWAWLYLSFAICGGDLRLGYGAGLAAGGMMWEMTLGRLLRRPFAAFWRKIGAIRRYFSRILKKFLKKLKILFASAEKWVTIKWNNRRHSRQKPGGGPNGAVQKPISKHKGRLPPQQAFDQGGGDRGYRVVYGGADHPALDPE